MFSTFDLRLLLYVIRLAGWLKHCDLSLSLSARATYCCHHHALEAKGDLLITLYAAHCVAALLSGLAINTYANGSKSHCVDIVVFRGVETTQAGRPPYMHRRKQAPKDETEQMSEATPVISFAFLSVTLADAKESNFFTQLATAARSTLEQQELWKRAECFFQTELGCIGRVVKVVGDLQPAANYIICAPRVHLLRDQFSAGKEFMTECASFKSLRLQLQMGRSAVVDHTGKK